MQELRRIGSNRRLILGLVLILLVNGFLFVREQRVQDYGLNMELPNASMVLLGDTFTTVQEPVDPGAAYQRYLNWLDRVRGLSLPDAASMLEREKTDLAAKFAGDTDTEEDHLDYVAVQTLQAQIQYLAGYGDRLANIQRNKENLLTFSLFNDTDSFAGRNIIKTAEEFEALQGVALTLGAGGAVDALLTFPLSDYCLLLVLLGTVLSFLEERKAGLWSVVHASPRGRLRLAVRRTAILFSVSVCGVLLLHGTDLALGFSLYGGAQDLHRAVQSVEALGMLPVRTTVTGFLGQYFLLRIAAAFFVGLLLWLLLAAVHNVKYTVLVAAGVLAIEYSLYTFLPVQSAFNVLKYFNLFSYISLSALYTNYLNIDLFGYPVGIRNIAETALVPLCLLLASLCLTVQCRKKPAAGRDLLGRAAYRFNGITDWVLCRLPLMGMELHKTLWIQKGIVITALLAYGVSHLSYTANIPLFSSVEEAERQYTATLAGPITEDTFAEMDAIQDQLDQVLQDYEDAKTAYADGQLSDAAYNLQTYNASAARTQSEGLAAVRSRCVDLQMLGAQHGFTPWLLDETPFLSVYGSRAQVNQQQAALLALLALTLLLAGSMACERQSGMTTLLRSTAQGRGTLLRRKFLLTVLTFVWGTVFGTELYTLLSHFSISGWGAPARNLSMLEEFPLNCSLSVWLALLYGYRWLSLLCCGVLALLLSSCFQRMETACIGTGIVLLLPSLLYAYLGVQVLRPLAVLLPVQTMPLLLDHNGAVSEAVTWTAALLGLSAACSVWRLVGEGLPRSLSETA